MMLKAAAFVLAIGGYGDQQGLITIDPAVRTYDEVVRLLNVPGHRVLATRRLGDRAAVVSLRNRPPSEARELLASALGIHFTLQPDGSYTVEDDPSVEDKDEILFNEFVIAFDQNVDKILRKLKAISGGDLPPSRALATELVEERIGPISTLPGRGMVGHQIYASSLPDEDKGALSLYYALSTDTDIEIATTGPLFYFFERGNSIRKLIPRTNVYAGDAYAWRDWQEMPLWVRERALAHMRIAEAALASSPTTASADPAALHETARSTAIIHRMRFIPASFDIVWQYGVLVFQAGASNWFGTGQNRPLNLRMSGDLLQSFYSRIEGEKELSNRLASTDALTRDDPDLKKATKSSIAPSLSTAFAGWAAENRKELVMEVSPNWDRNLASAAGVPAVSLGDWLNPSRLEAAKRGAALFPAWTIRKEKGVYVLRNEFGFLDKKYPSPMHLLVRAESLVKPGVAGLRTVGLQDLMSFAKQVTSGQCASIASLRPKLGIPRMFEAMPYVWALSRMSEADRKKLLQERSFRLPLSKLGAAATSLFGERLQKLAQAAMDSKNLSRSALVPLHPRFMDLLPQAELIIKLRNDPARGEFFDFELRAWTSLAPRQSWVAQQELFNMRDSIGPILLHK